MGIASHVEIFFPGSMEALQILLSKGLMEVPCTRPAALSVGVFAVIQHTFTLWKTSSELSLNHDQWAMWATLLTSVGVCRMKPLKFRLEREGLENS